MDNQGFGRFLARIKWQVYCVAGKIRAPENSQQVYSSAVQTNESEITYLISWVVLIVEAKSISNAESLLNLWGEARKEESCRAEVDVLEDESRELCRGMVNNVQRDDT